jgi:hypothetical protein
MTSVVRSAFRTLCDSHRSGRPVGGRCQYRLGRTFPDILLSLRGLVPTLWKNEPSFIDGCARVTSESGKISVIHIKYV